VNGYRHPDSGHHGDARVPRLLYIIGSDGHFCDAITLNCDNDEAASQRADNLPSAEAVDIELWQGARMVATISRKKQPAALSVSHVPLPSLLFQIADQLSQSLFGERVNRLSCQSARLCQPLFQILLVALFGHALSLL
jgi:hypothetical protein